MRWKRGVMLLLAATPFTAPAGFPCAQQTDGAASPQPPAGRAPEVRLEAHNGKSSFLLGERIQLDLVFRNATGESYTLNTTGYGDLSERKVEITPATGWMQWQGPSGHDYAAVSPLEDKEVRIPVVLNEGFVFREAGHYEVRVTTSRLIRGHGTSSQPLGAITTNSVGIDLAAMPDETEDSLVRGLLAEINGPHTKTRAGYYERQAAYARLAALQGDVSLRAKIQLILDEDEDMRQVTSQALASTHNLRLQLSLLEAAWHDDTHAPPYDLLGSIEQTHRLIRGETTPGWTMVVVPKNDEAARTAVRERQAYVSEMVQSVPLRTGENRAHTLYLLFETMGLTPEQQTALRPALIADFPSMDNLEKQMLLSTVRPPIRDAALVPALRAMLDETPTDMYAIARLIELDPADAKPYVVRAICDTKSVVPFTSVSELPDATLPEVDGCLGELLRNAPGHQGEYVWKERATLAARFATAAILPAVREGWKEPAQDDAAIALLLRYTPNEAVAHLQLTPLRFTYLLTSNNVFHSLHATLPPEMLAWLRQLVKDGPEAEAGSAAGELSQLGQAADRALLEERLARLRMDWSSKSYEIASAAAGTPAQKARKLDTELMSDLRMSRVWFVNNADAERLARGCMSDQCRQYGEPRKDDVPLTGPE
jgi:hypothetical protein